MLRKAGPFAMLVLALAAPIWAQVQSGSILVKVVDDQGAAVPGVTVTADEPAAAAAGRRHRYGRRSPVHGADDRHLLDQDHLSGFQTVDT